MTTAFQRGSEWRRWDLHIHTPRSVLNNGFGDDFEVYARRLLVEAARRGVAAIGVTDYFSIQGYRELRALLENPAFLDSLDETVRDHAESLLVLPNVELRGFVIGGNERRDSRLNFHVLFSDEIGAEEIERDFLARLEFTAIGWPGRQDERWQLTPDNLTAIGQRLKDQHAQYTQPPLEVGMMNAVIDHPQVSELLAKQLSRFNGRSLLVAPIDEDLADLRWDGQGHLTRKVFIQKSDMIFSANAGTRDFALGRRHATEIEYLAEFASFKPCIHGSDAHTFEELFEPDEERYNWIRANSTWPGLLMLLNEPSDRVFIGSRPPDLERIEARAVKTIKNVRARRTADARTPEVWFDNLVELNPGICAVIGNRGNGKSALAELIGLLGDTKRSASFSFLSAERFRHPPIGKADQFEATHTWADASVQGPRRLSEDPPRTAVERVRYIGQGFLEETCNEMDRGENSRFYAELQDVIFSHVSPADRQGHQTLAALLRALGEGINQRIDGLREEIRTLNRRIIDLSLRLEPEFRAGLAAQLEEVNRQLAALEANRPPVVERPGQPEASPESAALQAEVERLRTSLEAIDTEIAQIQAEDAALATRRAAAIRLLDRMRAAEAVVRGFADEGAEDARAVGVDIGSLLQLTVNESPIAEVIQSAEIRRAQIRAELDPDAAGIGARRAALVQELAGAEERLSLPQRQYQEQLRRLAAWEAEHARLVGRPETPSTVVGITAQIEDLDGVPARLAELNERRGTKVAEIVQAKARLKQQYEDLHKPVSDFLESSQVAASEAFKLRFSAQTVESGFADTFLAMIDQRKVGPFAGVDDGRTRVNALLAETDWTSNPRIAEFPDHVIRLLAPDGTSIRAIQEQLRQGFDVHQLFDFLLGLEYVIPTYKLTWDNRVVSELSPGERGNLLLIFYLLVDRNDIPLVIDQPEENLDNQTVFRTLVPCMRDARTRRQVIVVTHNPNLAVVCDADQVLYAEIRKDGSNRVTYETGAIEDPQLSRRIVDVLEGTQPAFDQRAAKYIVGQT